ncbi:hypothetical protein M419DRAFT_123303 [Trichoderma reesei RUT C-30]|uniref:Uncharacterized protein n=1 Tax=Hypocrea jecorina (strain ATCC 56765 / BCRC 32924 / NRRL 11460 / Rut C-30) TaxID=1344414 RepID=A0A024SA51_HYPJR|nr:hypothetical protein M419DRAFT_123303 [Trichoderma reesei RUT C-30]
MHRWLAAPDMCLGPLTDVENHQPLTLSLSIKTQYSSRNPDLSTPDCDLRSTHCSCICRVMEETCTCGLADIWMGYFMISGRSRRAVPNEDSNFHSSAASRPLRFSQG